MNNTLSHRLDRPFIPTFKYEKINWLVMNRGYDARHLERIAHYRLTAIYLKEYYKGVA